MKNTDSQDPEDTYYPLNLPAEFHIEDLNVQVEGLLREDRDRIFFMKPIEIISIETID